MKLKTSDDSSEMNACLYTKLMTCSQGSANDHLLATIIAAWQYRQIVQAKQSNQNILPAYLGLTRLEFSHLCDYHYPSFPMTTLLQPDKQLDVNSEAEQQEVAQLLLAGRAYLSIAEMWFALIVAVACQANTHLWQDLGLNSRQELNRLLRLNFPGLAQRNTDNMKWKKFIYKQLCLAEGVYTCRVPSCQVCPDYQDCFSTE